MLNKDLYYRLVRQRFGMNDSVVEDSEIINLAQTGDCKYEKTSLPNEPDQETQEMLALVDKLIELYEFVVSALKKIPSYRQQELFEFMFDYPEASQYIMTGSGLRGSNYVTTEVDSDFGPPSIECVVAKMVMASIGTDPLQYKMHGFAHGSTLMHDAERLDTRIIVMAGSIMIQHDLYLATSSRSLIFALADGTATPEELESFDTVALPTNLAQQLKITEAS